jgi:hypothetical protein
MDKQKRVAPRNVLPARTIGDIMNCLAPLEKGWQSLKKWPPNVFALTSSLLAESGAYRLAVSPPKGKAWPRNPDFWTAELPDIASKIRAYAVRRGPAPPEFTQCWEALESGKGLRVNSLTKPRQWKTCESILCLHAIADEACRGLGVPTGWPMSTDAELDFSIRAYYLLSRFGTLANINPDLVRVLPKLHTPQVGATLRSFSHHLTIATSEVMINWQLVPSGLKPDRETINLMLFPFPYEIKPTDFKGVGDSSFFQFSSSQSLNVGRIARLIAEGRSRVGAIDMIVFPESSLSCPNLSRLLERLKKEAQMPIILAGVRRPPSAGKLGSNYAEFIIRISDRALYSRRQFKHHRWCLDDVQIRQYHLGSALDPNRTWWEGIQIEKRELNFIPLTDAITICPLICEDLARQEPVAAVVRAVGPTLVIALLLDGPQMGARWPSRYATVLADDPGSSVLTLTSLGMALRSRPPGKEPARLVALWKDRKTGLLEIELPPRKEAIILTVCREWREEWTADYRGDGGNAATPFLAGIEPIGLE